MKHNPISIALEGLVFFGLMLCSVPTQAQTVIYRETFGNSGTNNYNLNTTTYVATDWQVYYTAAGTNGMLNRAVVSNVASTPANLDNIGTGYTTMSQTNGCIYTDLPTNPYFFFTTGHTGNLLDIKQVPDLTFSWYQKNNSASDGFRVAIQIDGNWYASSQLVTSTANVWSPVSYTFSTDAANWYALNFTAGSSLALGSLMSTSLSTNDITGFGLYAEVGTGGTKRFDTFTISVPECQTTTLLLGAFGFLLLSRIARRQSFI